MNTTPVNEAELKAIREAKPYAEAVRLATTLMERCDFLGDLKADEPLYNVALETTADALTVLIHDRTIVPAELTGEKFAKLLDFLEESVKYDLHIEAHNQIREWQEIQQELEMSAALQIPPHLLHEDQHLESEYEDRVSGMMEC